jgi:glycosyltransferase involved in cell wall biosynthesis
MNIAILSNTLNPHMKPLADEMYRILGNEFRYIEGSVIENERKAYGWSTPYRVPYLLNIEDDEQNLECERIIREFDAIVFGANPYMFHYIKRRIADGKLTYLQTERLFKRSIIQILFPPRTISILQQRVLTSWRSNVHVLATSAYLAWDYKRIGANTNRIFKFGYHIDKSDSISIARHSISGAVKLLCLGRIHELKHFDDAIRLIEMLIHSGIDAYLEIGGIGPDEYKLRELVKTLCLKERVKFLGAVASSDVKRIMQGADIFLFTSDYREGWGVTLNEAMSCGCAVVASDAAGSTPWLIEDMYNGIIYKHGDILSLFNKTMMLIKNQEMFYNVQQNAFETIRNSWNSRVAAERLIEVITSELLGERISFTEGIMSKVDIIKNNYFKG